MDMDNIKYWLQELLSNRFNIKIESIDKLSYLDLFYLYFEVYKNFDVKLTAEEICDNYISFDLLSDCIYNKMNNDVS